MQASELASLAMEVQYIRSYLNATRETKLFAVQPGMLYTEAGQRLAASHDMRLCAVGLWAIGRSLGMTGTILIDAHHIGVSGELNMRQLFLEALRCDCTFSHAYRSLGSILSRTESVTLHDGRSLNQRQLFLEALHLCPEPGLSYVFCCLAFVLSPHETLRLPDDRTLTQRQLYLEALRLDPENPVAYKNLGSSLTQSGAVLLPDGRALTQRQLYLESLLRWCDDSAQEDVRLWLQRTANPEDTWSRPCHRLLFSLKTNKLFATLLLGVQRLEEMGLLALAHQAMLEDMLECWMWKDSSRL